MQVVDLNTKASRPLPDQDCLSTTQRSPYSKLTLRIHASAYQVAVLPFKVQQGRHSTLPARSGIRARCTASVFRTDFTQLEFFTNYDRCATAVYKSDTPSSHPLVCKNNTVEHTSWFDRPNRDVSALIPIPVCLDTRHDVCESLFQPDQAHEMVGYCAKHSKQPPQR